MASAQQRKGYPTEIFQDIAVPIIKYLCPICLLVLNNPVQRFCGHRYCKSCIDEANVASSGSDTVCPECAGGDADEELPDSAAQQVNLVQCLR